MYVILDNEISSPVEMIQQWVWYVKAQTNKYLNTNDLMIAMMDAPYLLIIK